MCRSPKPTDPHIVKMMLSLELRDYRFLDPAYQEDMALTVLTDYDPNDRQFSIYKYISSDIKGTPSPDGTKFQFEKAEDPIGPED